jgi:Uma2 family endonuclease
MTQAKVRFTSFEEYLAWSDDPENAIEGRYELINGELVQLMTESGANTTIATHLLFCLISAGIPVPLVKQGCVEVQVPILQPGDAANRFPDLLVLRTEHPSLIAKRATITREMPPPLMAVEVASPGKRNHERDYQNKLAQYEAIGVEEYWIVDSEAQAVVVFELQQTGYRQVGKFQGKSMVPCATCPALTLTAEQILDAG